MKSLDIDFVRSQFPALIEGKHKDVAFFENAGGTYVPKQVIEHLNRFLIESKVQPYAPYVMSEQATEAIEQATIRMSEFINADSSEIVIGHCTTMNLYLLAMAMLGWLKEGDEIIVTNQDHESNVSPWLRLQKHGVAIKEWAMDSQSGELLIDDLEPLLSNKTKLVCMPHSSNIIGSVNDVSEVAKLVHEEGALLLVDGVSYAPHHVVDVKNMNVDIYVLSLYKIFGPHLGLMYVKEEHHEKLENQSLEFMPNLYASMKQEGAPNFLRIALNPGLVNHEEVASLLGLVEYFEEVYQHHNQSNSKSFNQCVENVFQLFLGHESVLAKQFLSCIETNSKIRLFGKIDADVSQRSPTYCLKIENGKTPRENAEQLASMGVAVQSGSFYAWRCLEALGINPDIGLLRVSMTHFNSIEEVGSLNAALNCL